ncbi:MAG TPA: hypothetical protein DIT42_01425, partial [Gammaproteobacteria bacterium]|nr:hypothetical protein [Gammaproteobacteria bacterium]
YGVDKVQFVIGLFGIVGEIQLIRSAKFKQLWLLLHKFDQRQTIDFRVGSEFEPTANRIGVDFANSKALSGELKLCHAEEKL